MNKCKNRSVPQSRPVFGFTSGAKHGTVKILCFPFEKHARQWGKLPERYNNDTANQPRTERMYYNGTERKDP